MRNKTTLPNITSLRFFLALLVVIYHIPEFSINRGFPSFNDFAVFHKGTEAVYMFFSLSGFLIIRNLYDEKLNTGTISLKDFYKRRVLRIFPLYYAVLIFGLLYYNILIPGLGFQIEQRQYSILEGVVLGGTFFSNVFATYKPGGILEVLWSIGIEEQFYLFVAPLLLLLPAKRIIYFLIIFTIFYFVAYNHQENDFLRKYKLLFYFFSISGVAAILSIRFPKIKVGNLMKLIVYSLFVLYFTSNFFVNNLSDATYQLFSMLLFSVFIFCIIQKPYNLLENPKLKYLGKISYGIYMLHAIVMQFAGFIFLKIGNVLLHKNPAVAIVGFNLMVVLMTILVSHLSYRYFESFFLKLKADGTNNSLKNKKI